MTKSNLSGHVLITGGAGYLGSILAETLLREGYSVHILDSFVHGTNSLGHLCWNPNLTITRGDCRDERTVLQCIKGADTVIPLAAIVGAPACARDPLAATSINRDAVVLLTRVLSKEQRLLFPVTNSGYGIGEKDKECDENSPLKPISLYGTTKVEAEKAVLDRGNAIAFRLATVFGMSPRMRIDLLVNDFTYRALRDRALVIFEGHFKRNYIHIRDIANTFLFGMQNFDRLKNEPYNVGLSDANISKLELAQKIKKHVPNFVFLEAPIGEDPDKRDYIVSNAKLESKGWKPKHSLDDGIRELLTGYQMLSNEKYGNV